MEKNLNPDFLDIVTPDNFLPPISKWTSLGGLVMLTSLVTAIAISSVFQYRVTVKAPAKIRPERELSLVQTSKSGKVSKITAEINQKVQRGDIIAYLDDSLLQQERKQLQNKINSTQGRLKQNKQQIKTKQEQIVVETQQIEKNIAILRAEINLTQIDSQNYQINLVTELEEAEANFHFAQDELARYEQLADTGAISQLQLSGKQSAYNSAKARLKKAQGQINPSQDKIKFLQAKIVQETGKGKTRLILVRQQLQQLQQQQLQIIRQLESDRQELLKLDIDLSQMVIRSPVSGTIQELSLRNRDRVLQVGEKIATIASSESELIIKAAVAVSDIEQIKPNQKVQIKVSSCPYTDYGVLQGKVTAISPDAIVSEINDRANNHYQVIIQPENVMLTNSQQQCQIKSGMDGKAEIMTNQETILKFVLRKARLLVNL